jgi:hypothetical protein
MFATFPAHLILFELITLKNIWWSVEVMKLLIMQSSPFNWVVLFKITKMIDRNSVLYESEG